MRAGRRIVLGLLALAAVAAVAATVNLVLLRSTQAPNDPVGRLSPRAAFPSVAATTPAPPPSPTRTGDDHRPGKGQGTRREGPDD